MSREIVGDDDLADAAAQRKVQQGMMSQHQIGIRFRSQIHEN